MTAASPVDSRDVFVIHGRDEEAKRATFEFLRSLGLRPLEWEKLRAATGTGSPFNIEVVEAGFKQAQAVVVLMTPDEEVVLREELRTRPGDDQVRLHPRANVLIEGGMAFALHPNKTIMVEVGEVAVASDWHGRNTIRMDGSAKARRTLANALKQADCQVDDAGLDWLDAGTFPARVATVAVAAASAPVATMPPSAPAQSAAPEPARPAGPEPDFAIDVTNNSDGTIRNFWVEFLGGGVEARNVHAVVRTDGQVERLELDPDWIDSSQRSSVIPGARTGNFSADARPVLQMTFENRVGGRFYLAADLVVDGKKVHVMHRTMYYERPTWSWLDPLREVPLH